ncbi:predicted protein [Nematostella vectensis]|uniref:Presequence translocated-associated motor subunit PAM17, mitochondrial n=2 Tax=Nematostella vectensis TaxID=45351 RepID=A7S783_NEMVE|nr:predicted protein [Nematostella vectensis]|eukprot:XP_001632547.1 predicted protein [Nematostella vectensis]
MAVALTSLRTLRTISRLPNARIPSTCSFLAIDLTCTTRKSLIFVSLRNFTSTSDSESTSRDAGAKKAGESPKQFTLGFEEFQKLKRKVRARQRVAGLPVAAVALMTSSAVSAYLNPNMFDAPPDQIQPILGMDPLIFCGLCGVASAGVGYIAGSAIFGSIWRFFNRDTSKMLQERESDFLERITAKRASSFSKFEDDYYGENIKTLSDYRQWLREQQKKQKAADSLKKKSEESSEQSQEQSTQTQ